MEKGQSKYMKHRPGVGLRVRSYNNSISLFLRSQPTWSSPPLKASPSETVTMVTVFPHEFEGDIVTAAHAVPAWPGEVVAQEWARVTGFA